MNKLKYLALVFVAISFFGCKKTLREFDGPSVIEFKPVTATLAKGTAAAPGTTTILVQLVGPQQASPITVPYTIDATSTAVDGTHYTIPTSGTVTIPANSSSGSIVITAIPANVTASRRLILVLSDGGTVPVNPNYRRSTITIQ